MNKRVPGVVYDWKKNKRELHEGMFGNVKDLAGRRRSRGTCGLQEHSLPEQLSRESNPCHRCERAMVSATGVAHAEGPTLAVQPLIWADLVILCSSNEGDDTSRLAEEHDNRQNKEGPEH
jgi:hypothetical protein